MFKQSRRDLLKSAAVITGGTTLFASGLSSLVISGSAQAAKSLSDTEKSPNSDGFIIPGEFEKQKAVWLGWPTFQWYTDPKLDTKFAIANIIQALVQESVTVQLMCTNLAGELAIKAWFKDQDYEIDSSRFLNYVYVDQVDIWQRDFGPVFLKNRKTGKTAISGFTQNQWGYSTTEDATSVAMTKLPFEVSKLEEFSANEYYQTSLVSEGGDRIPNGKGTLIVCRDVEFDRNPNLSEDEITAKLESALGVTNVIWLNSGVYEDPLAFWGPLPYAVSATETLFLYGPQTVGGHTDECARFANETDIILTMPTAEEAASDPIHGVNYARLQHAHRTLSAAKDQDGNPFNIIELPVPDLEYIEVQPDQDMYKYLESYTYPTHAVAFPKGKPIQVVKAASYANYLVTNNTIIAPSYNSPKKDAEAKRVLSQAYPKHKVVQIDADALNYAGGGIHCVTQHQPA
ncbi:peptidylarginine deiminase-like enzyme [Shewanella psychrophila]|uniref:Peptidylarginine deiminase-like enzyme n=1 Tax=Shewanella psychrophila TaxID=225848 RepID=A0A1S6HU77_9GAMM|nr:agmatine deiminase family protein [Shewanella psychrophila]AQS39051.1 peptidylarginine deiminase-like enzyme [Shewanella psychrophila]